MNSRPRLFFALAAIVSLCVLIILVVRVPYDYSPSWSPDGSAIAVTCYEPSFFSGTLHFFVGALRYWGDIPYPPTQSEICLLDATGSRIRLTKNNVPERKPTWSSDGELIAYAKLVDHGTDLHVIDPTSKEITRLTFNSNVHFFDWNPTSDLICYIDNGELWIVDARTGESSFITSTGLDMSFPSWSTDGERIAFFSTQFSEDEITRYKELHILSMGDQEREIVADSFDYAPPLWSPGGATIAYLGDNLTGIHLTNIKSLETKQLSGDTIYASALLGWSEDGKFLYAAGAGGIWEVSVDSGAQALVNPIEDQVTFVGDTNDAYLPPQDLIAVSRGDSDYRITTWIANPKSGDLSLASKGWSFP